MVVELGWMADADKFGTALAAVRCALRKRTVEPGEALLVEGLATNLRMSATPIREALAYLSGAGVTERQGRGYRVRRLEPADIVELYNLHFAYVQLGLEDFVAPLEGSPSDPSLSYTQRVEGFWFSLLPPGRRPRLGAALRTASDQLALVRAAEPKIFPDTEAELEELQSFQRRGALSYLRVAVAVYHMRRDGAATALSAEVHWSSGPDKI